MVRREHAGDESETGLQASLVRLRKSLQPEQLGHYSIAPRDRSKIEYGNTHWAYDYSKNPAVFGPAAWEGDLEDF